MKFKDFQRLTKDQQRKYFEAQKQKWLTARNS